MVRLGEAPEVRPAVHALHLPAAGRAARATCAPTASRPTSSPAAASTSCASSAEEAYGIPREQVIGSSVKLRFEMRDGAPGADQARRARQLRRPRGEGAEHRPAHRPPADPRLRQLRRRPGDAALHEDRSRRAPGAAAASRRRRARVRLRPRVPAEPARRGARQGQRVRHHGGQHEERLGERL